VVRLLRGCGGAAAAGLVCALLAAPVAAESPLSGRAEAEVGYGYDTNLFLDAVPALVKGNVIATEPVAAPVLHVSAAPRLGVRAAGHTLEGGYGLWLHTTEWHGSLLSQQGRLAYRSPLLGPVEVTVAGLVDRLLITDDTARADSFWVGGGEATAAVLLGSLARAWATYRGLYRAYPDLVVPDGGTERNRDHSGLLGASLRPRYGLEVLVTAGVTRNDSNDRRLDLTRLRGGVGARWQARPWLAVGVDYALAGQWLPAGTGDPIGQSGKFNYLARTDVIHGFGAHAAFDLVGGLGLFLRYEGAAATSSDSSLGYARHVVVAGASFSYGFASPLGRPAAPDVAEGSPPPPAVVEPGPSGGRARFTLRAPGATRVAVIGDFNAWDPRRGEMTREGQDGLFSAVVDVGSGRHAYSFVVDGRVRRPAGAAEYAPDGFGGENATLQVP